MIENESVFFMMRHFDEDDTNLDSHCGLLMAKLYLSSILWHVPKLKSNFEK